MRQCLGRRVSVVVLGGRSPAHEEIRSELELEVASDQSVGRRDGLAVARCVGAFRIDDNREASGERIDRSQRW